MSHQGPEDPNTSPTQPTAPPFVDKLQEQWHKTKDHAQTYPYVWGSYILVYTGLGVYLTWRYRKLRCTEDRGACAPRALKKLVKADEAKKPPSSRQ